VLVFHYQGAQPLPWRRKTPVMCALWTASRIWMRGADHWQKWQCPDARESRAWALFGRCGGAEWQDQDGGRAGVCRRDRSSRIVVTDGNRRIVAGSSGKRGEIKW